MSTLNLELNVKVSSSSVRRIFREQDMHLFDLRRVQALQSDDYAPLISFAQRILEKCATDPHFPTKLLFSNEESFTREGIFNTQRALCVRRRTRMHYDIVWHKLDFLPMFGPVL